MRTIARFWLPVGGTISLIGWLLGVLTGLINDEPDPREGLMPIALGMAFGGLGMMGVTLLSAVWKSAFENKRQR